MDRFSIMGFNPPKWKIRKNDKSTLRDKPHEGPKTLVTAGTRHTRKKKKGNEQSFGAAIEWEPKGKRKRPKNRRTNYGEI